MTEPRVLHICYGGVGGHRSVVGAILKYDERTSHHLIFLDSNVDVPPDTGSLGVPTHRVRIRRRGDLTSMLEVCRTVRAMGPTVSVCHTHRHLIAVFFGMLSRGRLPRLVLAEHQSNGLRNRSDNLWSAIGICLSRVVVFLTPDHVDRYPLRWLLRLCRRRHVVIPNGVSVNVISRLSQSNEDGHLTLGVAGRLIPNKDVTTVLRSLALLVERDSSSPLHLIVAGDGESRPGLESEARALQLTERVEFLGALSHDDMRHFFESLDIYVHSSLGETLSMSILEAGAAGLPIVASDVPGICDLLTQDQDALLVPPSNPRELADALDRLRDPDLRRRLGISVHDMVQHRFPPQVTAEGYRQLVLELIGGHR